MHRIGNWLRLALVATIACTAAAAAPAAPAASPAAAQSPPAAQQVDALTASPDNFRDARK